MYPKKFNPYVYKKAYTQMFIAVLFIFAQTWKQQGCPIVRKWINKLWQIHTVEYYSVLRRNKLLSYEKT
jgi:hypothetical protein